MEGGYTGGPPLGFLGPSPTSLQTESMCKKEIKREKPPEGKKKSFEKKKKKALRHGVPQ